ncbi:tyrosine-type recombinase/integrase [Aquitalea aquatica]|uniref:Tyrosine-type recombinase/integrase n=1 Tax=Aquitalea aquatica TaxID=3044273 RepID=A0A838Y0X7_9NEIS|nr:tyrosine-type recombinase/integrase [Aquitalea magnusonii]MBA4707558.1 tyrosine-type recombinase/integrase [Aquitalea magnusonii]
MSRPRQTNRGLTLSRIYTKGKRFYLFAAEALISPADGKAKKWHSLCPITDGEVEARRLAQLILDHNRAEGDEGDFPRHFRKYMAAMIEERDKQKPKEEARAKIHENGNKNLLSVSSVIEKAFFEFNVDQVLPVDVAKFVDDWEGRRMGQVYHSRLSDFFRWACRRGLRTDNPVREVSIKKPKRRMRYITDKEYNAIRQALLIGKNGRVNRSGLMVQCYIDLCYLMYQRTTEIRLLKWSDITEKGILFTPTKTEHSSGAKVFVPMTGQIWAVLQQAKVAWAQGRDIKEGVTRSPYIICNGKGKPYTAHGIGTAWTRARERAGIQDATLKDLRAKAMTDAKKVGYSMTQISVGAAHADEAMTEAYIKLREVPVSEVEMKLPAASDHGQKPSNTA